PTPILNSMAMLVYRFGRFELCSGELRVNGTRVRMQEKPLLLLMTLLENPQQVVTREQLRQRMWPSDTFVDYERGINVAIKKIRDSLGDSANAPIYIETVAKKGYKLLVLVETSAPGSGKPPPPPVKEIGTLGAASIRIESEQARWQFSWPWGLV